MQRLRQAGLEPFAQMDVRLLSKLEAWWVIPYWAFVWMGTGIRQSAGGDGRCSELRAPEPSKCQAPEGALQQNHHSAIHAAPPIRFDAYNAQLAAEGAFDFDDLLHATVALLAERPDVSPRDARAGGRRARRHPTGAARRPHHLARPPARRRRCWSAAAPAGATSLSTSPRWVRPASKPCALPILALCVGPRTAWSLSPCPSAHSLSRLPTHHDAPATPGHQQGPVCDGAPADGPRHEPLLRGRPQPGVRLG
jgi:hypothetical protein